MIILYFGPVLNMKPTPANIIISRTDSIGDVVLTLPMAKLLKEYFPGMYIGFMGKPYTRPVIEACSYVDAFIDQETFLQEKILLDGQAPQAIIHVLPKSYIAARAKALGIPLRIGTTNRLYHWWQCNKLVKLSRKNSDLHEAQLNIKLLQPLGVPVDYSPETIGQWFGCVNLPVLDPSLEALLNKDKYRLIVHPQSQGSAREWGMDNFMQLIQSLDAERFQVFISGTAKERPLVQPLLEATKGKATDITGKMDLTQFLAFINACNGLVACSTGPLHIAAALGKDAYGIYAPMRPIHPGRWSPLGNNSEVFVLDKFCVDCKGNKAPCHCIREVQPGLVKIAIDNRAAQMITS